MTRQIGSLPNIFRRSRKVTATLNGSGVLTGVRNSAAGIAAGLFGVLILCLGIGLVLSYDHLIPGLILGVAGLGIAAIATPVSRAVTKRSRKKYRDEILALSEKIKNGR